MSKKHQLRNQRKGTVINATSKEQEKDIIKSLRIVIKNIQETYEGRIHLSHIKNWKLHEIVNELQENFPSGEFFCYSKKTFISPDGGILYISGNEDNFIYPILISEVKNQGTNDLRKKEGLPKQARGNAIERLGKNLIGLRTALLRESIFPFVCFGYGCDFEDGSSILDRVVTMAMYGKLNRTYLYNELDGRLCRGSFYFRKEPWSIEEMSDIMTDIANRAILYYISKYGDSHFKK